MQVFQLWRTVFLSVTVLITLIYSMAPAMATAPSSQVASGAYHTVMIKSDGSLWGWGANSNSLLFDFGLGETVNISTPKQISTET